MAHTLSSEQTGAVASMLHAYTGDYEAEAVWTGSASDGSITVHRMLLDAASSP